MGDFLCKAIVAVKRRQCQGPGRFREFHHPGPWPGNEEGVYCPFRSLANQTRLADSISARPPAAARASQGQAAPSEVAPPPEGGSEEGVAGVASGGRVAVGVAVSVGLGVSVSGATMGVGVGVSVGAD